MVLSSMGLSSKSNLPFDISEIEIHEQLEKILISRTFSGSRRLKEFLKYIVASMLSGDAGRLKEYHIAFNVFGRTEAFDPGIDSVVRVEASRLRSKLSSYFESEGQGDRLVIDLPRGTYIPIVRKPIRNSFGGSPVLLPFPLKVSIAVLPFLSLNSDKESKLLCDGLTEELIDALTDTEWASVCPRTAVVRFKDHKEDIFQIVKRLRVSALVEGSVRKLGDRLRVSIRLVPAVNAFSRRLGVYDLRLKSALAAQQALSRLIIADLAVHLMPKNPDNKFLSKIG